MSAKSRLRKAFMLRAKRFRARVERIDLLRPRTPRQRPKMPETRIFPWGTAESISAAIDARRAKWAAKGEDEALDHEALDVAAQQAHLQMRPSNV